jgi:hypothetical protein
VLLNPAVLVESGLSDVLGAIRQILLSYLVHMHGCLRSLGQGQVHVGPITWEVLPQLPPSSVKTRACRIRLSCSVCLVRPSRPEHTPSLRCKAVSLFLLFRVSGLFVGNRDVCASESCFSRKVMSEVSVSRRRGSPSARSALPLTRTFARP